MDTNEIHQEWAAFMIAGGHAPSTVQLRINHLRHVERELGRPAHTAATSELLTWLAGRPWRPNTRKSYRASLRVYSSWLVASGHAKDSNAHALPPVKVPRAAPRPLPESAFWASVDAAPQPVRRAIFLAGWCGMRRSEVAAAHTDQLEPDLVGWALRVSGKGGHIRMVPLPDTLATELKMLPAGWVFPSPYGGHITPGHLSKVVSRYLPDGYTMHTLRHRAGTIAYQATRDLRAVQELLGHAKPETTALYAGVERAAIRDAMQANTSRESETEDLVPVEGEPPSPSSGGEEAGRPDEPGDDDGRSELSC